MKRLMGWVAVALLLLVFLIAAAPCAEAEDAARRRPYFRFSSGGISSFWDVDDLWSVSLGANLDRNWGGELEVANFEKNFSYHGYKIGELGTWNLIPQVRLRTSYQKQRFVPYLLAGIGVSFYQFNDAVAPASQLAVDLEGAVLALTAGAGLDYFIGDSVALSLEGKYLWLQRMRGRINGQDVSVDLSSPTVTVGLRVFTDENRPRPLADGVGESSGRFYFGVRVGGALLTDDHWVSGVTLAPETTVLADDINQTGGLLFGWNFDRNWSVELAVDSLEYLVKLDTVGSLAEYGMGVAIAQVRYRLPLDNGRWVPYLTAGAGLSYSEINDQSAAANALNVNGKGLHPACSVGAGVEYFLNRNLALLADVTWLYSWHHTIAMNGMGKTHGDFSALLMHGGFRVYLFD